MTNEWKKVYKNHSQGLRRPDASPFLFATQQCWLTVRGVAWFGRRDIWLRETSKRAPHSLCRELANCCSLLNIFKPWFLFCFPSLWVRLCCPFLLLLTGNVYLKYCLENGCSSSVLTQWEELNWLVMSVIAWNWWTVMYWYLWISLVMCTLTTITGVSVLT